jgi:hypothetical protein
MFVSYAISDEDIDKIIKTSYEALTAIHETKKAN